MTNWRIIAIVMAVSTATIIPTSVGINGGLELSDTVDGAVCALGVVGLFGMAWHRRLLNRIFWQVYFLAVIIWKTVYSLLPLSAAEQEMLGTQIIALDFFGNFLFAAPILVGLYFYAFRDKYPWDESASTPTAIVAEAVVAGSLDEEAYTNFVGRNYRAFAPRFLKFAGNPGRNTFAMTWHWPIFFFAPLWFAWRKMYGWAIVSTLTPSFLIAPFGHYLYFLHAQKTIAVLKREVSDSAEADPAVARAGGVSGWSLLAAGVVTVLLVIEATMAQVG